MNSIASVSATLSNTSLSEVEPPDTYGQLDLPPDRKGEHTLIRLQVTVMYESLIELNLLEALDFDPTVRSVRRADTIEYHDTQGKLHHYTPDYHVVRAAPGQQESTSIYECKPRRLLRGLISKDYLVWTVRASVLEQQGLRLVVVTDDDLRGPRLAHAQRFGGFVHSVPRPDLKRLLISELSASRLTLGELSGRVKLRVPVEQQTLTWNLGLFDTLYHLIAVGELHADLLAHPGENCPVWLAEAAGPSELAPLGLEIGVYLRRHLNGWPPDPQPEPDVLPDDQHNRITTAFLATERGASYLKLFSLYSNPDDRLGDARRSFLRREVGCSDATLYRFRGVLRAAGPGSTFDDLVPLLSHADHAPTFMVEEEVQEIIKATIGSNYRVRIGVTGRCETVVNLHHLITRACEARDLLPPANSTVKRYLDKERAADPVGFMSDRYGDEEASKLRARQGSYATNAYGELLAIDCTPCNVFIDAEGNTFVRPKPRREKTKQKKKRDKKARSALALRPTMITLLECTTSEVLNSKLVYGAVTAADVLKLVGETFLREQDFQRQCGVTSLPGFQGLPARIRMDSGTEFKNNDLQRALQSLGIQVIRRNKGTRHYGGVEERTLGTLVRSQHILPGTTMHNVQARGEYQAKANATIDFERLSMYHQVIVERHNLSPAPGQAVSRHAHAQSLIQSGQIAIRQPSPQQLQYLHQRMLPVEFRSCQRAGIELFNLHYVSHTVEMNELIHARARVQVMYTPTDLRTVFLVHPDGERLIVLKAKPPYGLDFARPLTKANWEKFWATVQEGRKSTLQGHRPYQELLNEVMSADLTSLTSASQRVQAAPIPAPAGEESGKKKGSHIVSAPLSLVPVAPLIRA